MRPVLDASAVLAYLHREPGWEEVRSAIDGAVLSAVNWSEVSQKILQKGLSVERTRDLLIQVGLQIIPFGPSHAETAAGLWERGRPLGLSLADRACLALAIERQTQVLTADRAWAGLGLDLEIRLLR